MGNCASKGELVAIPPSPQKLPKGESKSMSKANGSKPSKGRKNENEFDDKQDRENYEEEDNDGIRIRVMNR
eukprot:CAMPEP_0118668776 /NCGR_PEP_ID=MMETSP0785-20121206/20530_1 /TAXON_ID=91992 /ORGANISM="Bolidomonas pacifica, Strain CCMP 1866" /LENGTH=70 /DNA_ID=CAMNT_0006563379 /DNA_START=221 /DNA_END=433 /DNA_ORIENTATION=+